MVLFSCLLLVVTIASEPDTVWSTEFAELPAGWSAELHWTQTENVELFLNSHVQNVFDFDHSSLTTARSVYPQDVDSLVLVVEYVWIGWGAYSGDGEGAFSRSRILIHYTDKMDTMWDSVAGYLWFGESVQLLSGMPEAGVYSVASHGRLQLKLPALDRFDTYWLEFRGDTGGFHDPMSTDTQYAYVDWDLISASLLSYSSSVTD